jgi:hypothetical protein
MDINKKYGGVLKNCTPPMVGLVMYGNLYDDPTARFPDGADVRTSRVVSVDEENHKVETLNTIYDYEPVGI